MRYVYLVIVILSLSACNNSPPIKSYEIPEHEKIADRITARTVQKIEAETGLRLMGIGGGMMNQVRMMAISFEQLGEITMEQGRELVIYCMNEYLSAINGSEEIRPFLVHYPFITKDIQIDIYIRKQDRREVSIGTLCVVGAIKGKLQYDIKQPGLPSLRQVHEETYDEAVKILETAGPLQKIRKNTYHM